MRGPPFQAARTVLGTPLKRVSKILQEGWVMDFFLFFAGLFSVIAALLVIKTTSPNAH